MSVDARWDLIKQQRLCRTCLLSHPRSRCQVNRTCGTDDCPYRHHRLLHKVTKTSTAATSINELNCQIEQQQNADVSETNHFNCNAHRSNQDIKYRIVPVTLHSNDKHFETYAFLDDGSSLSMIEDSLAEELNLPGIHQPLFLKWTGDTHRCENNSRIVSVEVSSRNLPGKRFLIPILRTVQSLNLPQQSLNVKQLSTKYPYLKRYPIQSYENAVPRLLLGLDNLKLAIPLKVVEGGEGDPVATKTRLGWIAYGPSSPNVNGNGHLISSNVNFHKCECEDAKNSDCDNTLQNMLKEYFSLDSLGVVEPKKWIKSKDEERACQMLEALTVRKGCHFETGLLWKYDNVKLPNSLPMALRRHNCFMKKLNRNPELADDIRKKLKEYETKNYIRKLTSDELQQRYSQVWYIPIFVVSNQNKPGKTRLVWDAAATVNGVSLNSVLSKGPDQLVSLLSVLFRFQENAIGICADIREMFHQVGVRAEDQNAQRFLWADDPKAAPDVYVMQVLTFGASCSPSCAQFAKNKNANEFQDKYPRAVDSILHSHYVDDLLDSVGTETEAIQLAQEIKLIQQSGGFEIRGWISNSSNVVEALGELQSKTKRSLDINPESTSEKVLGMWWCTSTDTFTFALSPKSSMTELLSTKVRPTKRQVLRVLMSIFDPLGLIANSMIYIKILMQEIWITKLEWDEAIDGRMYEKWRVWVNHLSNINKVQIPRCYFGTLKFSRIEDCQLHIFVDASADAFAAVAYIRSTADRKVECRIMTSKTRVAPLRLTSIPRLELEAARLGVGLANTIRKNHNIKFSNEFYWSDSKTVLSWIQSDHRNYKQYVGFRVSEILESTNTHQWRYIPTKINVADDATKWQRVPDFDEDGRWFKGPPFLWKPEVEWPMNCTNIKPTNEELRPSVFFHHLVHDHSLIEPGRFSQWKKLLKTQAYVSRFIWNITAKKRNVPRRGEVWITREEFYEAEVQLFRQAQNDSFREEITTLKSNLQLPLELRKPLDKSSQIRKLSPFIDEDGLLRLSGRIDAATNVRYDSKRPILLSKEHRITQLLIASYHEEYHHQNTETVVNEIRQRFTIGNLRAAIKRVRKSCQACKNRDAKPAPPEMGPLPEERLSSFCRPFSYIGIDYFGPMYSTIGRRMEKRWGVLITCMTTRAIHIEVAHSLTSDACILAIKRFIARRGIPKEIRCDNGTNFHGAKNELQATLNEHQADLAKEFSSSITKWIFNPPSSPHMGGSWERLVQSVKKTLYQIMPTRNATDELLYSMLLEVERVVNSRPLTYVPLENDSDEVLTPNHFLIGTSNGNMVDSVFTDDGKLLRQNWLKSQQFANAFWRRWMQQYLPTLTRRSKWFTPVKPIAVGDIVIIADESNPRNVWPKGRVVEVKPGKDGQVRRAIVKTSSGLYERPAVKLAVLDVMEDKSP